MPDRRHAFVSDNCSGVCPEAWAALAEANAGRSRSYGGDPWTARAEEAVRALFGGLPCSVHFVFTGTAANALALATIAPPYGVVACTGSAHALTDECGAPGFFGHGLQLKPLASRHGKLDPKALAHWAGNIDVHVGKPAAVTLTQATELGTVYTLAELAALAAVAREHHLAVHLDGARLANALAALGCTARELVEASSAAAVVVGGTKNGLMGSEALVLFDPAAGDALPYRRKQAGQLASKHRFLSAPWIGVLESGAWQRYGAHANAMATRLARGLAGIGVEPLYPCEANEIFLRLDAPTVTALAERGWELHCEEPWGGHRLVCAWDTPGEDVDDFVADLAAVRAQLPV